jgi:hypothetical protein
MDDKTLHRKRMIGYSVLSSIISSPPGFSEALYTQSYIFCVMFCRPL